jgi:pyruvate dehydrogenase E1 component alpha subunit
MWRVDFHDHPVNLSWSDKEKIDLLRLMVRMRRFDFAAMQRYTFGEMGGWLVISVGQETVAACARSLLGPMDHTITGFRGMGHAIAAGMEMKSCMAELMGFTEGCSKGKAGACGFYAPHLRHWGCHPYAGSHTPLAAGLAFGLVHREEAGAVVCFLGDGAVNAGAYHEALNLAGLFNLPVVYLIENNGYAMGTSVARSSAFRDCLAKRSEGYGIEWDRFSDTDPYEMRARIGIALDRARFQRRPTVLEIETYRYYGFSIADANHKKYRSEDEIEERKARDPLNQWQVKLIAEGLLDEKSAAVIHEEAKAEALAAVAAAKQGRPPAVSDITSDVYWESDHATVAGTTGRHYFE